MKHQPLTSREQQSRTRVLLASAFLIDLLLVLACIAVALATSGCRRGDIGQRPPEPPTPVVGPAPAPEPPPVNDTAGEIDRYYKKFRELDAAANEEAASQVETIGLPAARKLLGEKWVKLLKDASEERRANERDVIGTGEGAVQRAKALWLKRAEECRAR